MPYFNIYAYIFCHGTRGVKLLREGGVNYEDYLYDLFSNVVVRCMDRNSEHRMNTNL